MMIQDNRWLMTINKAILMDDKDLWWLIMIDGDNW